MPISYNEIVRKQDSESITTLVGNALTKNIVPEKDKVFSLHNSGRKTSESSKSSMMYLAKNNKSRIQTLSIL